MEGWGPTWQDRLITEYRELTERTGKLERYVLSPPAMELPETEHELLVKQLELMQGYRDVLSQRIILYGLVA